MSFNADFYNQGRTSLDTLSERAFMMTISGFTAAFIAVSMVGASFSYDWTFGGTVWLYIVFILACMAVSIGGGALAQVNDNPIISVVGGGICAGAMGLMIGPFVAMYEAGSVMQAFLLTAGIVLVTGFIGAALPQSLASWLAPLSGLLIGAIVIQFGSIILAVLGFDMRLTFTILDWAVLLLFCGIMMYDLNMARRLNRTLDNAIDVAVNVFINFANIFIRVLSLLGNAKR